MAEREASRDIDETAAGWIARLDRGPLSTEDAQALDAWLAGDTRRRGALLRADALSMMSESARALGPQGDTLPFVAPAKRPHAAMSRRRVLAWTAASGAAAACMAVLGIGASAARAITTGLGEVRLVTLDDGSTVMLNTQTSVQVRYSDTVRRLELLYGEAYFTVARDLRRPFLVDVTSAHLRAARAAFSVSKLDGAAVDILVDGGDVSLRQTSASAPIVLPARTRLVLPVETSGATPAPRAVSADLVSRELAWREGKIAFEGERLDRAAAEFMRYSRTPIAIPDRALASEPVTGLFSASDPIGFSRAVASAFGAQLEVHDNGVVLTRPPKHL